MNITQGHHFDICQGQGFGMASLKWIITEYLIIDWLKYNRDMTENNH